MDEGWSEQRKQLPPEEMHRGTDLNIRALVLIAGGLVLLAGLTIIGADLLTPANSDVAVERALLEPESIDEPPDPRITQSHRIQRRQLERGVDERLSTYGWIDPERSVAHIPIERAVEIVLERGLPARMQTDAGGTNVPPAGAEREVADPPAEEGGSNEP